MKMPVIFVGHGSPMNAIEDNVYTRNWKQMAREIPAPRHILSISAHWYTKGSKINDSAQPRQVYDMYGFPQELYQVKYPVSGSKELSEMTRNLISQPVEIDNSWGIDHGTWSVLCKMYPHANIPTIQLSINANLTPEEHFQIGKTLSALRDEGVLIIGSGNVVHNLRRIDWDNEGGFAWADEFDGYIKTKIIHRDFASVINYQSSGKAANEAFPTPEHYLPLLYVLGASDPGDSVTVYNEARIYGSLSMTSYLLS